MPYIPERQRPKPIEVVRHALRHSEQAPRTLRLEEALLEASKSPKKIFPTNITIEDPTTHSERGLLSEAMVRLEQKRATEAAYSDGVFQLVVAERDGSLGLLKPRSLMRESDVTEIVKQQKEAGSKVVGILIADEPKGVASGPTGSIVPLLSKTWDIALVGYINGADDRKVQWYARQENTSFIEKHRTTRRFRKWALGVTTQEVTYKIASAKGDGEHMQEARNKLRRFWTVGVNKTLHLLTFDTKAIGQMDLRHEDTRNERTNIPPEGRELEAALEAYDRKQRDMGLSEEEKAQMNQRVVNGEEDDSVEGENLRDGYAVVGVEDVLGYSKTEAEHAVDTLSELSEQIPGLGGLLNLFVRDVQKTVDDQRGIVDADSSSAGTAPERPHGELGEVHSYETYMQARAIADLILEYADKTHSAEDRRDEVVNPFYNQTEQGFFLEYYYSGPSRLYTPWGQYNFKGTSSGNWDDFNDQILPRLGATVHKDVVINRMGQFGPVYALHAIDGVALPEPIEKPHEQYLTYDDANSSWDAFKAQYQKDQSENKEK